MDRRMMGNLYNGPSSELEEAKEQLKDLYVELGALADNLRAAAELSDDKGFVEVLMRRCTLPFAVADASEAEIEARLRAERFRFKALQDDLRRVKDEVRELGQMLYASEAALLEAREQERKLSGEVDRAAVRTQRTVEERAVTKRKLEDLRRRATEGLRGGLYDELRRWAERGFEHR